MRVWTDLAAPIRCVACAAVADGDLCARCANELVPMLGPLCARCGAPLRQPAGSCRGCADLAGFGRARSLVRYQQPAASLAIALKRRGRGGLSAATGTLMADLAAAHDLRGDMVAWVPAGRRAHGKGFDHAELLARAVAGRRGCPCSAVVLRLRDGRRQADAPRPERRRNADGLFAARPVRGDVLLVDDVFTTGATAEACALALVGGGADHVDVVTFARTVRRLSGP